MTEEADKPDIPELPPFAVRPRANVSGFTVHEDVVYRDGEGQPQVVGKSRVSRLLGTDEQPYLRVYSVGPDWKPLDLGWLTAARLIHLHNDEGKFTQTIPTPEQRAAAMAKVVELGVEVDSADPHHYTPHPVDFGRVRPQESARLEPTRQYFVRCLNGPAKILLAVLPGEAASG